MILSVCVCVPVCLYVCMRECFYVCMSACMCIFLRIPTSLHLYVCASIVARVSLLLHATLCRFVCLPLYVCMMHVYIDMCWCTCGCEDIGSGHENPNVRSNLTPILWNDSMHNCHGTLQLAWHPKSTAGLVSIPRIHLQTPPGLWHICPLANICTGSICYFPPGYLSNSTKVRGACNET